MSVLSVRPEPRDPDEARLEPREETRPVVIRRNAGLAALIGAGASAIGIAYLWRASQTGVPLDWALCVMMAVIAAYYLSALVDSRTPLLIADNLGVRIRLTQVWVGLPWEAIDRVEAMDRRGWLHDGRLSVVPHNDARALDGLDRRNARAARHHQKRYGAALTVPVGWTTRLVSSDDVTQQLADLAGGRSEIVAAKTRDLLEIAPAEDHAEQEPAVAVESNETGPAAPGRRILGGLARVISRAGKGRTRDVDDPLALGTTMRAAPLTTENVTKNPAPSVLREVRRAVRAEVTQDLPATLGSSALQEVAGEHDGPSGLPEGDQLRRPARVDLIVEPAYPAVTGQVRPIATIGDSVEPLVIDDYAQEPVDDPVIGPDLAAARTRLGLSVDDLADRTMIRPHVIESIEVDDFVPCGGDFYARGHLRTLARVLGRDPHQLVESFNNRYATAPVNARRVFEAELATGMTGSRRRTNGDPRWGLLAGVVLSLVLVWGVIRLFAGPPPELTQAPQPVLHSAVTGKQVYPGVGPGVSVARPLSLTLVAAHAGSHVVVRDGAGKVVATADMVLGEKKKLAVRPPVTVSAADAGAIEVQVKGHDRGVLGELGQPGRRTFRAPSR